MPSTIETVFTASVRGIGARTDDTPSAIDDLSAEEDRLVQTILTGGILKPATGWTATERGAGANMSVDIGSGVAKADYAVVEGTTDGQENYIVRLNDTVVNLAIGASDPTNPRIDEVYLVILDDPYDSQGKGIAKLMVRQGDPLASPVAPGIDSSWSAYLKLAAVLVGAAVVSIVDVDITDERPFAEVNIPSRGIPGVVEMFTGSSAPLGSFLCDGQAVSRSAYARLFGIMGVNYGIGDGSTTFNVPDLRQRFPIGKALSGTGAALGDTGGDIDHAHSGPSHVHSGPSHVHASPTHSHSMNTHIHTMPTHIHTMPTHAHTQGDTGGGTGTDQGSSNNVNFYNYDAAGNKARHTHSSGNIGDTDPGDTNATDPGNTNATDPGDTNNTSPGNTSSSGTADTGSAGTGDTGTENPPFQVVNFIVWA